MTKLFNLTLPVTVAVILFAMAEEAYNSTLPFALPLSVLLGIAACFAILYSVAEIK